MRGTLRAREMVAKARMASGYGQNGKAKRERRRVDESELTHGSDNLSLETKLVLETTGKVGNATLAVACDIGDLADVVEHVTTGEEQNGDQADGSPEVAALNDGQCVRGSYGESGNGSEDGSGGGNDLDPVDGAHNRRGRA